MVVVTACRILYFVGQENFVTQETMELINKYDNPMQHGDELNPFSFKEFIKNKNQQSCILKATEEYGDTHNIEQDQNSSTGFSSMKHFTESSLLSLPSGSEPQKRWIETYNSSATEKAHDELYATDTEISDYSEQSSLCSEEREGDITEWEMTKFVLIPKSQLVTTSTSYEGHKETSLIKENSLLRKQVKEFLQRSEIDSKRIKQLVEELHSRKLQEEREAKALETMVQSVEENLQLMTKRAIKAENCVSKLKQEIQQLQSQLEAHKSENESLRSRETTALITMRNNAQMASEYINKAARDAETSIKQLLTGRETLCFVSQLLTSIDKIIELRD